LNLRAHHPSTASQTKLATQIQPNYVPHPINIKKKKKKKKKKSPKKDNQTKKKKKKKQNYVI